MVVLEMLRYRFCYVLKAFPFINIRTFLVISSYKKYKPKEGIKFTKVIHDEDTRSHIEEERQAAKQFEKEREKELEKEAREREKDLKSSEDEQDGTGMPWSNRVQQKLENWRA